MVNFTNLYEILLKKSTGGIHNAEHIRLYTIAFRLMLNQKTSLACFRSGSDEIVGVQISFVITKDDPFLDELYNIVGFIKFDLLLFI